MLVKLFGSTPYDVDTLVDNALHLRFESHCIFHLLDCDGVFFFFFLGMGGGLIDGVTDGLVNRSNLPMVVLMEAR